MELYVYQCKECDTLNNIYWKINEWYQAPYCCECGQDFADNYKFVEVLEAKTKDAD